MRIFLRKHRAKRGNFTKREYTVCLFKMSLNSLNFSPCLFSKHFHHKQLQSVVHKPIL
jgi:hypothetical protein